MIQATKCPTLYHYSSKSTRNRSNDHSTTVMDKMLAASCLLLFATYKVRSLKCAASNKITRKFILKMSVNINDQIIIQKLIKKWFKYFNKTERNFLFLEKEFAKYHEKVYRTLENVRILKIGPNRVIDRTKRARRAFFPTNNLKDHSHKDFFEQANPNSIHSTFWTQRRWFD